MTYPILTPTEYAALESILDWAWNSLHQEPELCLKDVNYTNSDEYDCVMAGECGLGLKELFEDVIDDPNQDNIMDMISNLQYKLNAAACCDESFLGNSWETLAPLVSIDDTRRLWEDATSNGITIQASEGYVVENIAHKNRIARLQEHYAVDENGMINIGGGMMLDAVNSDLLL